MDDGAAPAPFRRPLDDAMYRMLFEASKMAMVIHDTAGRAYAVNAACCALMGATEEELCANTADDVLVPEDAAIRKVEAEQDFEGQGRGAAVHRRMIRKDGTVFRARVRKVVIQPPNGTLVLTMIEPWDQISDLEHDAEHDELTGLLNRRGVRRQVRITFTSMPALLAMIDVDRLKHVNDHHGHHVGDEVLRRVADMLATVAPTGAIVGRWSGDEFVVVCAPSPECPDPGALSRLIRSAFDHAPDGQADPRYPSTPRPAVSVGAVDFDTRAHDLDDAIGRADCQMYVDKQGPAHPSDP